jgi:hypothetical protein
LRLACGHQEILLIADVVILARLVELLFNEWICVCNACMAISKESRPSISAL